MPTLAAQLQPIQCAPGVQPDTDRTPLSTPHYTFTKAIRFWRGIPQKIGGWLRLTFDYGATIMGIARTLFSAIIDNAVTTVIGTNSYLYALYGSSLTNITPLDATPIAIANSIETNFATLANNPIMVTLDSGVVVVADTDAAKYRVNDSYTLSGATTTGGILNTALNATHVIRVIGVNTVSFTVGSLATSTATGGGASVVRATGLLTFTDAAHGMDDGWRVKITGAANTGGVLAAAINLEFIIRNVMTNTFDIMTAGTATSHVTAGGGGATEYQPQIAAGNQNESFGIGYGMGLYGTGLYGTSRTSTTGIIYPRIWSMDRYADRILMTPGSQTGIYTWDGDTSEAPIALAGAPTAVNYLFVSDNIVVTFGYQDVPNQIFTSDQGDPTEWSASSLNQVYQDVIEGANVLISSVPVLGVNLIYTSTQTYRFSYIGLPNVWEIKLLDNSIGIIGQMARCSVNNVAYWMGLNNLYRWSGGNIEIIPANTQDQCTALNYVFGNLNVAQQSKSFAWYNEAFNEVWFHYPDMDSNEPNRIIRVSVSDNVWSVDEMDRTCSEYPAALYGKPRLISMEGGFYTHEVGYNDNDIPLEFNLASNLRTVNRNTFLTSGFIPDSIQTGTIQVAMTGKQFPQSTAITFNNTYDVLPTTERVNTQFEGRFWQYEFSGDELDQNFVMGVWQEYAQQGAPN